MVALPDSVNWEYLIERVRRYNENPTDDLLYRIGNHTDVLTMEDSDLIQRQQGGYLNPEQRYRVLDWVVSCQNTIELECDLALPIFGRDQLTQWLEKSVECPDGICFSMHWMPKPGAPEPDVECDFPWKLDWETGVMFWGNYPGGFTNQFDFSLECYPNQQSFATPGSFCEEGSRYTTPTDEEADLMSVAQVLEHFS
jgi:hypothetical protein